MEVLGKDAVSEARAASHSSFKNTAAVSKPVACSRVTKPVCPQGNKFSVLSSLLHRSQSPKRPCNQDAIIQNPLASSRRNFIEYKICQHKLDFSNQRENLNLRTAVKFLPQTLSLPNKRPHTLRRPNNPLLRLPQAPLSRLATLQKPSALRPASRSSQNFWPRNSSENHRGFPKHPGTLENIHTTRGISTTQVEAWQSIGLL